MKVKAVWPVLATIVICASFFAGTRVGVNEFIKFDAQYKASILAHQIIALKGPKRDQIIEGMEISLNGEIANHGRYMESRLKWLWNTPYRDEEPIKFAARYRHENPYSLPRSTDPSEWRNANEYSKEELASVARELDEGQKEIERLVGLVLQEYVP